MTTEAIEAPAPPAAPTWTGWPRRFGWALLVCWILLPVSAVFVGERSSSLSDLQSAIASGDVTEVRVAGGLPEGTRVRGYAELEIQWRDGPFAYYVEVREARPLRAGPPREDIEVVKAGLVNRWAASEPDLRIVRFNSLSGSSFSANFTWWRVPTLLVLGGLLLYLVTVGLLARGPQPWRATRWAWFWIFGIAAPIGLLSYLVLGGPTALSLPPQPEAGRLTGGWAFLLAFVVSSILASISTASG